MSFTETDTDATWLSPEHLEQVRAQVPIVYVEAVPVRVDGLGNVTEVGLLLRQAADGSISRLIVSGRVKFGELVREALLRHCEKDLGPLALPRIPICPSPFTVLDTFLKSKSEWHVYRQGDPWRRSWDHLRASIQTEEFVAVCFAAASVETYRQPDMSRHPIGGRLGPDVADPVAGLARAVAALVGYPRAEARVRDARGGPHTR